MRFFRNVSDYLASVPPRKGMVFTNGCFDVLHVGHIKYLQSSRSLGDYLVIGLNADTSVRRLKGDQRPLNNEEDRALVLLALSCVNYVILFDEETPARLIESLKPQVLTKGGDYRRENIVGADFVEKNGGKVVVIPFEKGYSTTGLIEKITKL